MKKEIKKNKAKIGGNFLWKNLIKNWLHQGVTYMDRTELYVRIIYELILVIGLCSVINYYFSIFSLLQSLVLAFLIAHTLNWLFNANFWALIVFASPGMKNRGSEKTINYLKQLKIRIQDDKSISSALIFGSISRNVWHERSDIDVRFVREPGMRNIIPAAFSTMRERFLAFLYKQPLDLFLVDHIHSLEKMRDDESPFIVFNRNNEICIRYPDARSFQLIHLK